MKLSEFDYELPKKLIAQTPIEPRDYSRLLILDSQKEEIKESKFFNIIDELWENDVLVLNKTKVINARLHFRLENWKIWEILLHKQLWEKTWDCLVYPWKKLKPWKEIKFYLDQENLNFWFSEWKLPESQSMIGWVFEWTKLNNLNSPILKATIKEISEKWRIIEFDKWGVEFLEIINKIWEIPLPPYIKEKLDNPDRYQTIWAETEGSAAAPTASLHFTPELLEKLKQKWVIIEKVLLHVWLGTFMPVSTDDIKDHKMHWEYIELEENVAQRLNKYKKQNKRIIAVWTTAIRVLESMSDENWIIQPWSKETEIFIYPGYKWKFVDAIITNFHLPKSTLLMLVSSFSWIDFIKKAYNYAVENKFRFFSFWDAMFIKNKKEN